MARPVSMTLGDTFGFLTVLNRAPDKTSGQTRWNCQCICGQQKQVYATHLRSGTTVSCGCKRSELHRAKIFKHGRIGTREHNTWNMMNARCHTPTATSYERYGGAGITVCAEWRWPNGFIRFLNDMGERPEGKTLERIDPSKGYFLDNCRWATPREQQRNRKDAVYVDYKGERIALADLARDIGMNRKKLYMRVVKMKWPLEKAVLS